MAAATDIARFAGKRSPFVVAAAAAAAVGAVCVGTGLGWGSGGGPVGSRYAAAAGAAVGEVASAAATPAGNLHVRVQSASAKTWSDCATPGNVVIGNATVSAIASMSGGRQRRQNRSCGLCPCLGRSFPPRTPSVSSSSSCRRNRGSTRSSPRQKFHRPRPGPGRNWCQLR